MMMIAHGYADGKYHTLRSPVLRGSVASDESRRSSGPDTRAAVAMGRRLSLTSSSHFSPVSEDTFDRVTWQPITPFPSFFHAIVGRSPCKRPGGFATRSLSIMRRSSFELWDAFLKDDNRSSMVPILNGACGRRPTFPLRGAGENHLFSHQASPPSR